ncbi:retrovirus-related pol polyprotein from transposon TNT 1-94 [Tanacetum coccineum]
MLCCMERLSTKQERECKLYDEFDKFTYKKGETLHEYYLRFTLLLNDMNIYKMPLEQFQVNHNHHPQCCLSSDDLEPMTVIVMNQLSQDCSLENLSRMGALDALTESSRSKLLIEEQDPMVVKHRVNTKPINYVVLNNDYYKRFVRQSDLYSEHAYWKATSVPALDPSHSSTTIIVEVPKELPKVSMVNTSLKELKRYLTGFDQVVKERTTVTTITKVKMNQILNENERLLEQVINKDIVNVIMYSFADIASVNVHEFEKCLKLKNELQTDFIEKEIYDKLVTKIIAENEHLKQTYKKRYDSIKPARIRSKEQCDDLINKVNLKSVKFLILNDVFSKMFGKLHASRNDLRKLKGKALVDNDATKHPSDPKMLKIDEEATILRDLVEHVKSKYPLDQSLESACRSNHLHSASRVHYLQQYKKDKIRQTPSSTQKNKVEAYPRKVKSCLKNKDCVVQPKGTAPVQHSKLHANSELKCVKFNGCMLSDNHDLCVLDFIKNVNARKKSKSVNKISKRKVGKPTRKVFSNIRYIWRPTGRTFTIVGNACLLTRITTTTEVPLRKPTALENETPKPVVTLVYSKKPRKSKTNVPISKSKVLKFVSANKKEPSTSWGSIVSYVPSSCLDECRSSKFFSDIDGAPLLYVSCPKGLKDLKSWLSAPIVCLSALCAINHLARHSLVRGLPKLKFEKDHLCSACAMGKSKKKPHKPKLYLLHMDLCGPMRVVSVNGKKYMLVIIDDYSRFTWVKCLRSKDEAPDFIINFPIKVIPVLA